MLDLPKPICSYLETEANLRGAKVLGWSADLSVSELVFDSSVSLPDVILLLLLSWNRSVAAMVESCKRRRFWCATSAPQDARAAILQTLYFRLCLFFVAYWFVLSGRNFKNWKGTVLAIQQGALHLSNAPELFTMALQNPSIMCDRWKMGAVQKELMMRAVWSHMVF